MNFGYWQAQLLPLSEYAAYNMFVSLIKAHNKVSGNARKLSTDEKGEIIARLHKFSQAKRRRGPIARLTATFVFNLKNKENKVQYRKRKSVLRLWVC